MKDVCDPLKYIQKIFLCGFPLQKINTSIIKNLLNSEQFQLDLISKTTKFHLIIQYPVKITYQRAFLKLIIQLLESQSFQIVDELFEEYGRLLALPVPFQFYKHYIIDKKVITLKEDPNLITEGTTGLRTWQASLALSEWIVKNCNKFESQIVLELGSGIGLCGLVTILNCNIKSFLFSDYHKTVLEKLCDNIELNYKNINKRKNVESGIKFCGNINGNKVIKVLDLDWGKVDESVCKKIGKIDKIIAADVVYDEDLFLLLIDAVDYLFKFCQVDEFYLSCTERNPNTLEKFLNLAAEKFEIKQEKTPEQDNFLWEDDVPVKQFILTHK